MLSNLEDARRVADALGVSHVVADARQAFRAGVIDTFINGYMNGLTPNPCVICNPMVKWETLLREADRLGADHVATGHYAKVAKHPRTGRWTLWRPAAKGRDQTYALYGLSQWQLARTLMPLGDYAKDAVRAMTARAGLPVADKPDSQDACFVPDNDYAGFIRAATGRIFPKGRFVDEDSRTLGEHEGVIHYTVGQRKGFGISFGKRMYVKRIDAEKNEVVLADDSQVFGRALLAGHVNFMGVGGVSEPMPAWAKIRYGQVAQGCTVSMENGLLKVVFDEPVRAVTPGQAVVVYDEAGEYVLGGGTIERSVPD